MLGNQGAIPWLYQEP